MADLTLRWSTDLFGKCGYGEVGAVVGALAPRVIQELRRRYDTLFFLVPGYGAQGGKARDVQYAFDQFGHGAIVNSSRGIMCAWQKIEGSDGRDYQEAARNEAIRMRDDICRFVKIL
jgi:orotidine-5'-phosphate decarboxylase